MFSSFTMDIVLSDRNLLIQYCNVVGQHNITFILWCLEKQFNLIESSLHLGM